MDDLQTLQTRLADCHREFRDCARELGQTQADLAAARGETADMRAELESFKLQRIAHLEKELEILKK